MPNYLSSINYWHFIDNKVKPNPTKFTTSFRLNKSI